MDAPSTSAATFCETTNRQLMTLLTIRLLMSFLSFSAALLNFTPTDHLWHLYTPDPVQQRAKHGAIMHVTPEDGVRLIEIPFARMSQPILSRVFNASLTAAST